jgi:hypothetical protein
MLTDPQREHIRLAARTMQIIVGALATGVAFFAGIVLSFAGAAGDEQAPSDERLLTYMAVGAALIVVIAWAVVPALIAGQMRQKIADGNAAQLTLNLRNAAEIGDVGPLTVAYQVRLIVAAALLEGVAFFNLIAYMIERQSLSLIVAGLLLLMILSHIPTVGRLQEWVERELNTIDQLRQMRPGDAR